MAQIYYQMGQYRYNGSDKLLEPLDCAVKNLDWQFETDTSPWYRDFYISLTGDGDKKFQVGESYYLTFSLPRDLNYALSFALKFIRTEAIENSNFVYSENATPFQFIRYIEVPRSYTNGSHNSLVCMYKIEGESSPRIAISNKSLYTDSTLDINPEAYLNPDLEYGVASTKTSGIFYEVRKTTGNYWYRANVLYHDRITDTYFMPRTDTKLWDSGNILEGDSDAVLNWKWENNKTAEVIHYKLLITPRKSDYDGLLFQMKRIQEDGDIISSNTSEHAAGINIHGRFIDLDQNIEFRDNEKNTIKNVRIRNTFKIYHMTELNTKFLDSNGTAIHRLGIWGHPELMLALDGEQILIGQSGYYELNDYDVTKLCVAAEDDKDAFVLDYQYKA